MSDSKKIFYKKNYHYYNLEKEKMSAHEFVKRSLDANMYDYSGGAVEIAQEQADNTTGALARLVEILFDRGLISREDVYTVVGQSAPDDDSSEG